SAMKATWLPSALSMAAPALASWETSLVELPARSRTAMSGMPLVFEPAGTTSSALVVKATRLPAALIVDSRLGAFPDEVPPVLAPLTRLEATESNDTHCPLGLIEAPWLSPLASTPPGPMLIRSTESIVGGAPAVAEGVSVVRKMSLWPLLSFGTRLLAAAAKTTRTLLLAESTATVRLVHLPAFWALHWRELPVGRTFRSPPPSGMLTRSIVPGAGAPWAVGPQNQNPPTSASAETSPTARRRRPNREDRDRVMSALTSLGNTG